MRSISTKFKVPIFFILGLSLCGSLQALASSWTPSDGGPERLWNAYTYQTQEMNTVNWLYIGFAPRINDPSRVKVYLSKQGFTLRVNVKMNLEEVARYPEHLITRAKAIREEFVNAQNRGHQIQFSQPERVESYFRQIDAVVAQMQDVETKYPGADQQSLKYAHKIDLGFVLLRTFFPQNIKYVNDGVNAPWIEGDFVYPLTINLQGLSAPLYEVDPPAKGGADFYNVISLDERRSHHNEWSKDANGNPVVLGVKDHLFNGFPAFWIQLTGKGIGVHGPIRHSSSVDSHTDKRDGYVQYQRWLTPEFDLLRDPSIIGNIQPLYRFDVIRTANSEGCFRAEPMEIRHILPASPEQLKKVEWRVLDDFDTLADGKIVDVHYYITNHYKGQDDPMDWYRKHFLSFAKRQNYKQFNYTQEQIDNEIRSILANTQTFPYLNPMTVEFYYAVPNQMGQWMAEEAPATMTRFNRAGSQW